MDGLSLTKVIVLCKHQSIFTVNNTYFTVITHIYRIRITI